MNFLSVINGIEYESLGGMLSYDKQTKELTFTNQEDGKSYKCYVNSMSALVNFMKYIVPIMGVEVNNVNAAYMIWMSIAADKTEFISKYINLPLKDGHIPLGSYSQWLKIAIETVQILDNIEHTNGTWSAEAKITSLPEGAKFGYSIVTGYPTTINWGDGNSTETNGIDSAEHFFTSTGNFTVIFNGTAFPEPTVNHTETSVGEATLGKFEFKKTPTA